MARRVFWAKKEIKDFVDGLDFVNHYRDMHYGINVKIYYFPEHIQEILWESLSIMETFRLNISALGDIWENFSYYLVEHWPNLKTKRAIRKALAYALTCVFNGEWVRLFSLGQDIGENDFIYSEIHLNVNGKREVSFDGLDEWVNYGEKILKPVLLDKSIDDFDRYRELSQAYTRFSQAWDMKKYVCNF